MNEQSKQPNAFFVPLGQEAREDAQGRSVIYRTIEATHHTSSPWGEGFQHGSPPAALIAYLLEKGAHDVGLDTQGSGRFVRMNVELLGAVPLGELTGHAQIIRPGKRITLMEAVVTNPEGREVIRGRGWWLKTRDTSEIRREVGPVVAGPEGAPSYDAFLERWASGYIDAIEVRHVPSPMPGHDVHTEGNNKVVWGRSSLPVMAGEEDTPWTGLMKIADIANGVNEALDPAEWNFMNVDMSVYLHRLPTSDWTGILAEHNYGLDGVGTTIGRLFDEQGPIGAVTQALMLDRH